jgi:hypothetical protein
MTAKVALPLLLTLLGSQTEIKNKTMKYITKYTARQQEYILDNRTNKNNNIPTHLIASSNRTGGRC